MKKGIIYARFSCGRQTEQSIEGQLRKCHEFAKKNDIVIVKEYIDRAKTAQNDNRPFFQKMIADSEKREWEYVIVYSVDRFSRDDGDYGADKRILRNNGVKLLSATETIGTNADGTENLGGILTEGLLVALAKYYSRELSQKIRRGQYESLQKKNYLGGSVIFGYYVKDKKICINEAEAEIVREMFELYSKGKSAFDIEALFKKKGFKTRRGAYFHHNSIMNLLKNPKFIGTYEFGGQVFEDYHPAIISKDLFERVQERIKRNKLTPSRSKAKEEYILTGKLYCGHCKTPMAGESGTSHTGQSYYYYKCSRRKNKAKCDKKAIKKEVLENLVIKATIRHILKSNIIDDITTQILAIQESQRDLSEITLLKKQLGEVNSYIKNILSAIKKGIITASTQEELQRLETEKEDLEYKIIKAEAKEANCLTKDRIEYWFEQFLNFDETNQGARQYLVSYFINKIYLYDDKLIIIYNHDGDNRTEFTDEEIEAEIGSFFELNSPPEKRIYAGFLA